MGDVITRFKLETTQYDSKLRDSAKNLADLTQKLQIAGKDFERFAEKNVEAARSLGEIESGANNAKDKLRDLVSAYNNVAKAYNNLTKEQQATDYGKAMAASLDQLQQRITQTKDQLYSMSNSGKETGGVMDTLAKKFTINLDALQLLNLGLKAAKGAVDIAKEAFFSMETNVDDWGRTLESGKAIYDGFLQALNTGDISGYLSRIDQIVSAAKEAYNALDELGTKSTIINPQRARLQARQTELKAVIRREGATSDAGKAAQAELRQIEKSLVGAFKEESKLNYNAFKALVNEKLVEAGINLNNKSYNLLLRSFSDTKVYDQLKAGARGSLRTVNARNEITGEIIASKTIDERNTNQKLLDLFTDAWRKQNSGYLTATYTAKNSAASALLGDARYLKQGGGGSGGSGGGATQKAAESLRLTDFTAQTIGTTQSMKELQAQLKRYQDMLANATDQFTAGKAQAGIAQTERLIAAQPTALQMGISVEAAADTMEKVQSIRDQIQEGLKNNPLYIQATMDTEAIEDVSKAAKGVKINMKDAASMVNTLGSALSNIEDPGAKVASTVAQAIATIAMAYSDALAKDSSSKFNIWSFIAAAAAATVSMATTISSIHSATGYERGGVVQGNTYSNDQIPAMLNAGETVLTRAQAGVLSTILTDRQGGGGGASTPYVTGDKLILGINNYAKKQGWGELVFSRR